MRADLPENAGVSLIHGRSGRIRFDLPSEPIGIVLRRLIVEGEGAFKRGFDRLLERARQNNAFDPSLLLEDGVKCGIDYWGNFTSHKLHPMIITPRSTATNAARG